MQRALELASLGRYGTHPNPRVGCVLVSEGQVVGEGWHRRAGEAHAEVEALHKAGSRARGASCYVTLEPCHHQGRTPPCDQALLAAGVKQVIVATTDPDRRVNGQAIHMLSAAGIHVETGLLEQEARTLNRGYFKRHEQQRPQVTCKLAMSLDGRTAAADGNSRWISSPESRADVQRLRASSSAILVSAATVLADNPRLTVRDIDTAGRQPLRVVLDPHNRVPATARLFQQPGETLLVTSQPRSGIRTLNTGRDLGQLLQHLATHEQVNELLLEAGPRLAGAFLQEGYIDSLRIYMAPCLLGPAAAPLLHLPIHSLGARIQLHIQSVRRVGPDLCLELTP